MNHFVRITKEEREAYEVAMARERQALELLKTVGSKSFGFWVEVPGDGKPMPVATKNVDLGFAEILQKIEKTALYVSYKGWSRCRVCDCMNGSKEFVHKFADGSVYKWPEGYLHYVTVHGIIPDDTAKEFASKAES